MGATDQSKEFDRIEMGSKIFAPPPVKFGDLDAALDAFSSTHKLMSGPPFPFDVRTDFVKVTDSMDMVPITIQLRNRDITFAIQRRRVEGHGGDILGRVTTIMHEVCADFSKTRSKSSSLPSCWKRAWIPSRFIGSRCRFSLVFTAWTLRSKM